MKDAIKAAVLKQRTFKHDIEGRCFTVLLPTDHELQVVYLQAGGREDLSAWTVMTRKLLESAVSGWLNVTVDDIAGDGDNTVADFDKELVPLLLDAHTDWAAELSNELTTRIAMKRESLETAKKVSDYLVWLKGRKDVREFEAIGLQGLDDPRPPFDVDVQRAMRCWNFCGGWFPERIAYFDAIYDVPDHEKLVEMLIHIRDNGN